MIGVIVNTFAVIAGSVIGLTFNKYISKNICDQIMITLGLCAIFLGINGILIYNNALIVIISMAFGTFIGTILDIDSRFTCFTNKIESKFSKSKDFSISRGFISSSLLFCVGSMTIIGSLNAGLNGNNELLFSKSILDFISSIILSISLGIGVIFSSLFVFTFQGILVVLSRYLSLILTEIIINEVSCCGSILIIALGLNMLKLTKIKILNIMPSIFMPIIIYQFIN